MTRLCIALDVDRPDKARTLVEQTTASADLYKVGLTLFGWAGATFVTELSKEHDVFLDLKLHDIPAQVGGAVAGAVWAGARYVTVHAAGGAEMIGAAVQAAAGETDILAVTVLTSLDESSLERMGLAPDISDLVERLAEVALEAGARGLVCSPLEIGLLRKRFGAQPLLVVPGIRGPEEAPGDQARTLSAKQAAQEGADIVVVGRPITQAPDPAVSAERIKSDLA
jgi:orotidine-5'-phosphate decarboxylase